MNRDQLTLTKQCAIVWQNVEYLKSLKGATDTDIARAINRSVQTVVNRRSHPRNTTVDDLIKLGKYFKIPPASLLMPLVAAEPPKPEEYIK
nr:MAG TPA: SOS-response transcriptional repressor [Caudoviricetes sp.]DAK63795.1 MAG TPA: SOS-response transcriptional repressor [Bacteriophage sp.]